MVWSCYAWILRLFRLRRAATTAEILEATIAAVLDADPAANASFLGAASASFLQTTNMSFNCPTACSTPATVHHPFSRLQSMSQSRFASMFSSPIFSGKKKLPLIKIGVTGAPRSGKTSLVRAMVGLDPTGEIRDGRSEKAKVYYFPANKKVQIWDLPQGSEPNDLTPYDFFIVTVSTKLSEEVFQLAREIEALDKRFMFVRTMIDIYARMTRQVNFRQADLQGEVRKHFVRKLQAAGIQSHRVFLLSVVLPRSFDFPEFLATFTEEFAGS